MDQLLVRPRATNAARIGLAAIASLLLTLSLAVAATPVSAGPPASANITIVKFDETNTRLEGVTFTFDGGEEVATDADGVIDFGTLAGGATVTLVETGNPSEACNDPEDDVLGSLTIGVSVEGVLTVTDPDTEDDLTARVVAGGDLIYVTNTCGDDSDGSGVIDEVALDLTIAKEDQDGEPLADVEFSYVIADVLASGFTTGDDGTFAFPDVVVNATGEVDISLTETVNDNDGCGTDVLGALDIDVISATEVAVTDLDADDALTATVENGTTVVITNDCGGEPDSGEEGGGGTIPDTAVMASLPGTTQLAAGLLGALLTAGALLSGARRIRRYASVAQGCTEQTSPRYLARGSFATALMHLRHS